VALLATLFIATAPVPHAAAQSSAQSDFAATDLNHDVQVDREEYARRMKDTMFFADRNKDGVLTPDELPGADAAAFQAADRNGDGVLSVQEFTESRFADFDAADTDGSGTLSPAEVEAWDR
jgi:Ca2+-binding EF-hand superfamily protein